MEHCITFTDEEFTYLHNLLLREYFDIFIRWLGDADDKRLCVSLFKRFSQTVSLPEV